MYPNNEPLIAPKDLKLPPSAQRQARAWLKARSAKARKGLLILTVISVVLPPLSLFWLIALILYYFKDRALLKRGVFVPAAPISADGVISAHTQAAEAWQEEGSVIEQIAGARQEEEVAGAFAGAHSLALAFGQFIPAVIAHYQFVLGGKQYRSGKYFFSDERYFRDKQGYCWVLVHPGWPRSNSWLVSELP